MFSPDTDYLRATVLQPDGETEQIVLPEEEAERLRRMQEVVGGHLEVVPIPARIPTLLTDKVDMLIAPSPEGPTRPTEPASAPPAGPSGSTDSARTARPRARDWRKSPANLAALPPIPPAPSHRH